MKPLKVLFFSADPLEDRDQELQLSEELRQIRARVSRARYGHRILFEEHGAVRADDLLDYLARTDARVVHFSGHGGRDGLVLVDRDGYGRHRVDAAALQRLFRTHPGVVRLVVLSACSSESQAQAIADVVGCAIGTISAISDPAAITFNSRFYEAIANGHSVGRAFDEASMALQVHRVPDAERPRIFVRKGVNPNDLVLVRVRRPVPVRVAAAAAGIVLTAAAVVFDVFHTPMPPELTASDYACGTDSRIAGGIQPLARTVAVAATPDHAAGPAGALEAAKALYRTRNYAAALPLFERAAAAKNGEGMACLGHVYLYGRGVDPQPSIGFDLVHRAATEERDPHAMYALGLAYLNGVGTERRDYLAWDWFQKAAEKGYAEAMRMLGVLYQQQKGESGDRTAIDWFRRAIAAGSVDAGVDLGLAYEKGLGTARNEAEAVRLYYAAATAGSPRGMFAMGYVYERGIGVPRDYDEARAWYLRAAARGSADAMNSIGNFYREGVGVRRSRWQAIRWYKRAREAGSPLAAGNLDALRGL